jgi:hypothetical protein
MRYLKAKKLATKKTIQINENILYIDEWEITTGSDDEAKSLQDFVLGKEVEIYGKSNESITINGEKIDFESIIKTSENMLAQCVSLGIYNNLTRAERQIIDLPVVEWKLGYYYGAAFIRHWFLGSGSPIKLDDENIDELLEKSAIFQEHLEKGIKLIETNIYNSDNPISICDSIAKFVIENRKKEEQMWIDIDLSPEYEPNINRNNRLSTYSITESDLVNLPSLGLKDEDFATAIGSVIIGFYFTGNIEIKGIDRGDVMADIYYRFTDGFNFIDDGIINAIISQPLGSWEVNPFGANLKTPSPGFSIQNKDFNSLYRKMNRTNPSLKNMAPNFSVITKYRKIKGVWTVNFVSDLLNCKCYVKREN